MSWLR